MADTAVSRRDRKKEETRSRLVRVAVQLFREQGFEVTTVDAIIERADVAKGTFFNYFPRKEAVLAGLSEEPLIEAEERADAILAADKATGEKLLDLLAAAAAAYEKDRELSRFVLLELMKRAFLPAEEIHARWHKLLARFVEQGQWTGDVRREIDTGRAAAMIQLVFNTTVLDWVCSPAGGFVLHDEIRVRLSLLFEGLAE